MDLAWQEAKEGASLTLEVDATDGDRRDARDVAEFLGHARLPAAEGDAMPGTRGTSVRDVALVLSGIGVGAVVADGVVSASLACGYQPSPYLGVVAFLAGALLPGGAVLALRARAVRALRQPVDDRFTLSLDGEAFVLRGRSRAELRVPLGDVHAFEGDRRLVLVRANGARTELPCDVGDRAAHRAIAARFGDALARLHAQRNAYRGRGVAFAEEAARDDALDDPAAPASARAGLR